jgi:hypothetical protein
MTIAAVYVGNDPSALTAADSWLGKNYQGNTVFTGDASWSDYTGSVGWEVSLWANSNTQIFWSIPLFSVQGNLTSAAAGAYNSYYVQDAEQIAASQKTGPIYVRPGWEFNGSWEPWSAQSDPTDYVAAFQQFVDSYRSVSNRFEFVWTPNVGSSGMSNVAAAYPGNNYVDVIGVDMYDNNTYQSDPTAEFNYFLTEPYGLNWLTQFASANGKPLAVPEWGVNGDNDSAFIQLADQWFQQNNVLFQSYWNSDGGDFSGKLSDGSMPDAAAAYLAAFGVPNPKIAGTLGPSNVTDAQTAKPFSQVSISDPNPGSVETVTLTLDNTSGVATDANGVLSGQGLTKTATGVYTLSGSTAVVTAELDALVFTPTGQQVAPGSTVTTDFTLYITDGGAAARDGTAVHPS